MISGFLCEQTWQHCLGIKQYVTMWLKHEDIQSNIIIFTPL